MIRLLPSALRRRGAVKTVAPFGFGLRSRIESDVHG